MKILVEENFDKNPCEISKLVKPVVDFHSKLYKSSSSMADAFAKIAFLTSKVFVTLIFNGFCGKEEEEEEEKDENDRNAEEIFDQEGCGMADGEGQENVSKDIEHKE